MGHKKEAMLIAYLVKGDKACMAARKMGDIKVEDIRDIQVTMPEGTTVEPMDVPTTTPKTTMTERKPKEAKTNPKILEMVSVNLPEYRKLKTIEPIPSTSGTQKPSVSTPTEGSVNSMETESPENESNEDEKEVITTRRSSARAQKRKTSYKEPSTSTSESQSEESTASERDESKKKKTEKRQKKRAKDGRKLIDLSERERGPGGRFGGYKEGCTSKSKRPRCRTSTPKVSPSTTTVEKETADKEAGISEEKQPLGYPDRPLRKFPTTEPRGTTEARKMIEEVLASQPKVPLEHLDTPDIERARSIRPTVIPEEVQPIVPQPQSQPVESSQGQPENVQPRDVTGGEPYDDDGAVEASQRF